MSQLRHSRTIWTASLAKLLRNLAPRAGLEPATLRLTAGCSTIELPRIGSRSVPARCGRIIGLDALGSRWLVDQVSQVCVLAGGGQAPQGARLDLPHARAGDAEPA